MGLTGAASPHLLGHQDAERIPQGLAHRPRRAQERVAAAEELVGGLEEAQALGLVARPRGPTAEDIEGEADGAEVKALRPVPDLGGSGRFGRQGVESLTVLLVVLARQLLEPSLHDGDESRQRLRKLVGGPEMPRSGTFHA